MMSCATLNQAIQIALKYYRTAGPLFDLTFEFDDDALVIGADNVFDLDDKLLTLVTEELFTTFPLLLDLLVGNHVRPREVDLNYPAPPHQRTLCNDVRMPRCVRCAPYPVRARCGGARAAAVARRRGLGGDVRAFVS